MSSNGVFPDSGRAVALFPGQRGHVIGVDFSEVMLAQARAGVARRGWRNVELVCADLGDYRFPPDVDAILSTSPSL